MGAVQLAGDPPAIEAMDLVKTYRGGVRALDGLSLSVRPGTVFALLGPNGAGKSTTVKILTTLSRPDAGQARVAGLDVLGRPDAVRRRIGTVAQRSGVDQEATGRENLLLQGRIHGLRGARLRRRADDLLERFGLAEAGRRLVRTYSGGMRRKLDIALGLVHEPSVLFLDEPTTGLDPESRAEMWREIGRLSGAEGRAVLLTTHYLEEADQLAAELAIVDRGRVVAQGTPDELKGELRGDGIVVDLARGPGAGEPDHAAVRAAMSRVDGISDVRMDGDRAVARAEVGASAVPAVLAALDAAGQRVGAVAVTRPSLDDVYLRHTGRSYASATAEAEALTSQGAHR